MITVYIMVVVLVGIIIVSTDRIKDDSLESRITTFLDNDKRAKRCN